MQSGERGLELVGDVVGDAAHLVEEPPVVVVHGVEGVDEFGYLGTAAPGGNAAVEVSVFGDAQGGFADFADPGEQSAHQQPAAGERDHEKYREDPQLRPQQFV